MTIEKIRQYKGEAEQRGKKESSSAKQPVYNESDGYMCVYRLYSSVCKLRLSFSHIHGMVDKNSISHSHMHTDTFELKVMIMNHARLSLTIYSHHH